MARWIATVNSERDFDIERAVSDLDVIYWGKYDFTFEINDFLYLYLTKPIQQVKYKFKVISIINSADYPREQLIYWKSTRYLKYKKSYIGLMLIGCADSPSLKLQNFRELGFLGIKENLQGRRHDRRAGKLLDEFEKVNKWFDYIDGYFSKAKNYDFPDEANVENETFPEGGKKQVTVNIYERDPIARKKCIEIHGLNCFVCEMNFGSTYGNFADGFIHVHHKKPLHQIQQNYQVDPRVDLIPVCPNCHAMLHRNINGEKITVENLKILYESNKA